MLASLHKWLTSFKGALILAIVGLFNVAMAAYNGSPTLWLDVAFVCFWVYMAKRALNTQAVDGQVKELNEDQKARVKAAAQAVADATHKLDAVCAEIDAELKAEALAAKLKAREKKDDVREVQGPSSNGEPDDS
jgi:hypothetical protein